MRHPESLDAERSALLRAAWEHGIESLNAHGPQLGSDAEFEAFLDECEAEAMDNPRHWSSPR